MCCSPAKFVAIAAPRGHAKSTAVTHAYTIANIVFRERSFILIVADTETQAGFFLGDIKKELTENEDLMKMFGIKGLAKDSLTDFIIEFDDGYQARIIAKGASQSMRGVKWDNKRPDLIVCDDLENEEMVMNKDRREAFRRWFSGTLIPCRSKNGIIRVVGTILHTDSQLNRIMPRLNKKDAPAYVDDLREIANTKQVWYSARYRAHSKDMKTALWPEFKPIEWLIDERREKLDQGLADLWAQEMLNVPLDEEHAPFKRTYFQGMEPAEREQKFNYYISTDFATTEKQRADYSVFTVSGINSEGRIYILHVIRDRMESPEILSTLFELCKVYDPLAVFVESGQIWNTLKPLVTNEMIKTDVWFEIHEVPSITDKRSRTAAIRQRMKVGIVKFDKEKDWYPDLEEECLGFPRLSHDDQVDTLSMLGLALNKFIEAPTPQEEAEEAYEDEQRESGIYEQGRSQFTGY